VFYLAAILAVHVFVGFSGLMNDGIGMTGRAGSLLCVMVWILLFITVANPEWTTVKDLGMC
jgi:hypothetical protein